MSFDINQLLKDKKEIKEYFENNELRLSIKELIKGLSDNFDYKLQNLKVKARTNIKLIGKDPKDVLELLNIMKKNHFKTIIEVLIISDYRKKHDNTLEFKYLLSIPFSVNDKLDDDTLIIDNMTMEYDYDHFLESPYLTLKIDESIIPNLIYTINKNNVDSYNPNLYKPTNYIERVLLNKIREIKNHKNDLRKH